MFADLRAAARQLRRAPGFSLLVVLVLALGIGVNVATFGAVDALLFRPPAGVREPDRVRRLQITPPARPGQQVFLNLGFTRADVDALRARRDRFARVGAYAYTVATRTDPALATTDPLQRRVQLVGADADYLRAVGVPAARGRTFGDDEAAGRGAGDVVVLTDAFWRRAYDADPAAVGRTLYLSGRAYAIVGVLAPGFRGVDAVQADAVVPLAAGAYGQGLRDPNVPWLSVVARLAPGVDARGAAATATAVLRALDAARPQPILGFGQGATARTVQARSLTERFGGTLQQESPVPLWLLGATGAVLLVACANVANLLLVRAERRRREIATRAAVGAGWGRLVRQLFVEGAVLAAAGGALGLALAAFGARLFRFVPGMPEVGGLVGGRAAVFAVGVTAATTLLFALAPAVAAARAGDGAELLRAGARQVAARAPLRTALVGVQFAASLALLGAGGLFVRSLRNVRAVDVGFDAERLLVATVDWRAFGLDDDAAAGAVRRAAAERLRAVPGVAGVTRTTSVPYGGLAMRSLRVPGRGDLGDVSGVPGGMFFTNTVDTAYARTLGIPVVRGRWLAPGDEAEPGAVVVNEAFARRVWPGADAVGQCVFLNTDRDVCTRVAGVVRDARTMDVTAAAAPMFFRLAPDTAAGGELLVRARPGASPAEVARVAAAVGASLRAAEPRIGFATAKPIADLAFGGALAPYRIAAAAFSVFGALALGMAAVGLYGAAAYAVAQRAGEFGVRMALGARGRDVAALALGQGLRTVAVGALAGTLGTVAVGRLLRAKLYGVGPLDPLSLAVTAAVLAGAALLAGWIPARRAARVDPASALRAE